MVNGDEEDIQLGVKTAVEVTVENEKLKVIYHVQYQLLNIQEAANQVI